MEETVAKLSFLNYPKNLFATVPSYFFYIFNRSFIEKYKKTVYDKQYPTGKISE